MSASDLPAARPSLLGEWRARLRHFDLSLILFLLVAAILVFLVANPLVLLGLLPMAATIVIVAVGYRIVGHDFMMRRGSREAS